MRHNARQSDNNSYFNFRENLIASDTISFNSGYLLTLFLIDGGKKSKTRMNTPMYNITCYLPLFLFLITH